MTIIIDAIDEGIIRIAQRLEMVGFNNVDNVVYDEIIGDVIRCHVLVSRVRVRHISILLRVVENAVKAL